MLVLISLIEDSIRAGVRVRSGGYASVLEVDGMELFSSGKGGGGIALRSLSSKAVVENSFLHSIPLDSIVESTFLWLEVFGAGFVDFSISMTCNSTSSSLGGEDLGVLNEYRVSGKC